MVSLPGGISRDNSLGVPSGDASLTSIRPPEPSRSFNRLLAEKIEEKSDEGHPAARRAGFRVAKESLPDFVDQLEGAISECMAAFRFQAEEALSGHLRAIERVQADNDQARAELLVENCKLREQLGMRPSENLQHVLFKPVPQRPRNQSSQTVESKAPGRQKQQGQKRAGGSWQPLVAWIPSDQGAGQVPPKMERSAAPWSRQTSEGSVESLRSCPDGQFNIFPSSPKPPHRRHKPDWFAEDGDEESDEGITAGDGCDAENADSYKLLGLWRASTKDLEDAGAGIMGMAEELRSSRTNLTVLDETEESASNAPWYIINPDSHARLSWDMLSLFMVSYDLVLLPLFAFDVAEIAVLDWFARLFWTFDMGLSCCTGFLLQNGIVEYGHRAILCRYLTTWFVPDLVIVGSDWAGFFFVEEEQGVGQLGVGKVARLTRITRAVRFLRLLRLLRMQNVLSNLTERIQSDIVGLVLYVFKLLVLLAIVFHYVACTWWAIGTQETTEQTWVKDSIYAEKPVESQYLVCLLWAASQFLGGMAQIAAVSDLEHLFTVGTNTVAFIVTLMVAGIFTAGLTKRHLMDDHGARRLATLKSYLRQNRVQQHLAVKICRNAKHVVSGDLTEADVEILGTITEPLRIQLHVEMHSRFLQSHPLFADLLQNQCTFETLIREVCHEAVWIWHVACSSTIFEMGEEPKKPKVYIAGAGDTLEYTDAAGNVVLLRERQWIAEPALWTAWTHRGTLSVMSNCNVAVVCARSFRTICRKLKKQKKEKWITIARYAKQFSMELNSATDASDLWVHSSHGESSAPQVSQYALSSVMPSSKIG